MSRANKCRWNMCADREEGACCTRDCYAGVGDWSIYLANKVKHEVLSLLSTTWPTSSIFYFAPTLEVRRYVRISVTSLFTICLIGIEVVGDIEKKNRNMLVDVDDDNVAKLKDLEPDLPVLEWETRQDELYVWILQFPLIVVDRYPLWTSASFTRRPQWR